MKLVKDVIISSLIYAAADQVVAGVTKLVKTIYNYAKDHSCYVLNVSSGFEPYGHFVLMIKEANRNTLARNTYSWEYVDKIDGVGPLSTSLNKLTVSFGEAKITLNWIHNKVDEKQYAMGQRDSWMIQLSTAHSLAILEEYVRETIKKTKCAPIKSCSIYSFDKYEIKYLKSFSSDEIAPPILPEGKLENIEAALTKFYTSRSWYRSRGIPWRQGWCFYGPPGTGKTSLIQYLAMKFHKNIYYISASALKTVGDLARAIADFNNGNFLVIEDIDCMYNRREPLDSSLPSFNDILNMLDGFLAPKHVVLFFTTNNVETLDPALIRPGRVDRLEELTYLDDYQAKELFLRHYPESKLECPRINGRVTPAELQQRLLESNSDEDFIKRYT